MRAKVKIICISCMAIFEGRGLRFKMIVVLRMVCVLDNSEAWFLRGFGVEMSSSVFVDDQK